MAGGEALFRVAEIPGSRRLARLPDGPPGSRLYLIEGLVHLGTRAAWANIRTGGPAGQIGLSSDLIESLRVVREVPYCMRLLPGGFDLGPVAAIAAGPSPGSVTPARLEALKDHLRSQEGRGGLFVVTDGRSIDPGRKLAAGRCRLPGGGWLTGIFPLPRAIFRRYGAPLEAKVPALLGQGVRVFNQRRLCKWEAWALLSADPRLRGHVPETRLLGGMSTVLEMLGRWPCIYVKPRLGSHGIGVMRIERRTDGLITASSRRRKAVYGSAAELARAVGRRLPPAGLAQQGIEIIRLKDRMIDFRIVVQKDGSGRWAVTGKLARLGAPGLPVSNVSAGGSPTPARKALAAVFGDSPDSFRRRLEELSALALDAASALDAGGILLGDLGLDLAYDVKGRLWVLEANCRDPDHTLAWRSGSWPMYRRLRAMPMEYARYLAGFEGRSYRTGWLRRSLARHQAC